MPDPLVRDENVASIVVLILVVCAVILAGLSTGFFVKMSECLGDVSDDEDDKEDEGKCILCLCLCPPKAAPVV